MIPYIEVIGKYSLTPFAVVEPSECWFEIAYYEGGEFEIYAPATADNLYSLKMGNYVKIPNLPYIWVIKSVRYVFNSEGARMIDVKGYDAKWLLHQRIILNPFELPTDLKTAVYQLVYNNLGLGALSYRKIIGFNVIQPTFNITIAQTQAPRSDLYEFVEKLLKANECGSYCTFENGNITYRAIEGRDLTDEIMFSQSMDNLLTADYYQSSDEKKTWCRVVSTFSEEKQISATEKQNIDVEYIQDYNLPNAPENIDRIEMIVNSNISTKLFDSNGNPVIDPQTGKQVDISPSSSQYQSWQQQEGKNQLGQKIIKKEFSGEIDLRYSNYKFGEDFFIGDMVLVRDEFFGYEDSMRILKYRLKQDSTGYGEEVEYGTE